MKKNLIKTYHNRGGFTLTEVLLAVLIVGLIGISLAALTRSASREAGIGRSRIMLRNNLATFSRTLREDIEQASHIEEVAGKLTAEDFTHDVAVLLKLAKNTDAQGNGVNGQIRTNVTYCFNKIGVTSAGVLPTGAYIRGAICRRENNGNTYPSCTSATCTPNYYVLTNVKYIPSDNSEKYPVPLIIKSEDDDSINEEKRLPGLLNVRIITELPSTPVVNEVIEESFAMPVGISPANE